MQIKYIDFFGKHPFECQKVINQTLKEHPEYRLLNVETLNDMQMGDFGSATIRIWVAQQDHSDE